MIFFIFDVWHGPEEKLFSSEGKDIERTHILMTQGMGGSKTIGGSHVHITVGEFEALNDHPKVRQHDYNSRFDRKRYFYDHNFVIEPSSLNGGEPFFANPYNHVVHDKPSREYHEFVKNEVRGRIKSL